MKSAFLPSEGLLFLYDKKDNTWYFFTCVDIANKLLTRHSPLAPLGQVDE